MSAPAWCADIYQGMGLRLQKQQPVGPPGGSVAGGPGLSAVLGVGLRHCFPVKRRTASVRCAAQIESMTHSLPTLARQVKELERQLRQKDKALAEAVALLELLTQVSGSQRGGRGRFHGVDERSRVLALVERTTRRGARQEAVCRVLGLSARTVQRWREARHAEDKRTSSHRQPPNRLSAQERWLALELLRFARHRGLSPRQLVPRLADQGIYVASESTFYRLVRAERLSRPAPRPRSPPVHVARAPNQIWSWDITYLQGPVRGPFLYLYLVMDLYSRRIMGWRVHAEESARHAARLIHEACAAHGVDSGGLVLRSDNGGPMRGATLQYTLRCLGILPSFSRPGVSNDNPFSEALFRTLKVSPSYPRQGFASCTEARRWVTRFVAWYNGEHLHSGLGFVTPEDRYSGRDKSLLVQRRAVYAQARRAAPHRWSHPPRPWERAGPVLLASAMVSRTTTPLQFTAITGPRLKRGPLTEFSAGSPLSECQAICREADNHLPANASPSCERPGGEPHESSARHCRRYLFDGAVP